VAFANALSSDPLARLLLLREAEGKIVGTILIVLLVLVLLGALPAWPYSTSWGYGPSGGIGLILVILVILILAGRL
jgi:Protein of unknown function (DUF3309)